jgi:hypothetical protein
MKLDVNVQILYSGFISIWHEYWNFIIKNCWDDIKGGQFPANLNMPLAGDIAVNYVHQWKHRLVKGEVTNSCIS